MAMYARSGYGYRFADKVAEQDRMAAANEDQKDSTLKAISASKAWRMVARGEIDVATAMRLIDGLQEGDEAHQHKAAEKSHNPE